jgi:fumarate reductase subunit C
VKGKEYIRPIPTTWWLKKKSYTLFMLREVTALFVAGYSIFLIVLVYRAGQGPDVFSQFVEGLKSPVSIVLHLLVLAMAIYHSITWSSATPKIMVLWRGDERIAPGVIAGWSYAVWLVVSVLVAGIALAAARGG